MPNYYCVGEIAKALDTSYHRIVYFIREHGIEPVKRIGANRIFDESGLQRIRELVAAADARRGK